MKRIHRRRPTHRLDIEELAKAIHRHYCETERALGKTAETNRALRPWEELPEDLREANRAQAMDIPHKLHLLGYELTTTGGVDPAGVAFSPAEVEKLAVREHRRWADERRAQGWTRGAVRDDARKRHPLLVAWEELADEEKDKDRRAVLNVTRWVKQAGFRLRKLGSDDSILR
ncbi:MAG: RyR domain protein [Verrucomicrobia bacterium]|nr:RyR domain protein [Verrucomicrobiota bacterium]